MHLKSYCASFVSYKTSMFSAVSSFSFGFFPLKFLTPHQLAAIVEDLTAEEIRWGTKLTPAIQIGFEDTYYEVQIVLEVTILQEGLSIILGVRWTQNRPPPMSIALFLCINPTRMARQHRFIVSLMSSRLLLLITHTMLNWVLLTSMFWNKSSQIIS